MSDPAPSAANRRPHTALLLSALAFMVLGWSFNFIAGKVALRHLDPLTLASFRIELAAILLLLIYALRRSENRFQKLDFWNFAYLGFFGVVMNSGLFTVGLAYTTAGHSSIILACGPVLVLLLARVQRQEILSIAKALGMGLSFFGVAILVTEKGVTVHSPTLAGDLITLTASGGFALYAVFGKNFANRYDSVSMNTFNNVSAAILLLPLAIYEGRRLDWAAVGWEGWIALAYMSAVTSVAAYLVFYWALRYMTASRLAALSYFEPLLVVLLGVLFLREHITRNLVFGGGLVLFGVYLTERGTG